MAKRFLNDIKGFSVLGSTGRILGTVADLEIDKTAENWTVTGLVVSVKNEVARELGIQKPFWREAHAVIPWSFVRSISDTILLNLSVEHFTQLLDVQGVRAGQATTSGHKEPDTAQPLPQAHRTPASSPATPPR